jgi:hypothetical protein
VEPCVPQEGFLREYLEYAQSITDAALWFHLGSVLSAMSVAASGSDYYAQMSDGRNSVHGLQLWCVLVGLSGSRKNGAMEPAMRVLRSAKRELVLPTDGSQEAIHDTLCEGGGSGILWYDEMRSVFDLARRSYSSGFTGWLLQTYKGGPLDRKTKSGGLVGAERVRLSLLGGIPPSTLQGATSREDWRSGFLPRFCFWGARRTRYVELPTQCAATEAKLAVWLREKVIDRDRRLLVPHEHVQVISEWYRDHVELRSHLVPDEVFSTLARLQTKGLQIAALFALSRLTDRADNDRDILVERQDVERALEVIKLFRKTTLSIFATVGSTLEATEENAMLRWLSVHPASTVRQIAEAVGMSARHVNRLLLEFDAAGIVSGVASDRHNRGRGPRPKLYSVVDEPFNFNDVLPSVPSFED